MGLESALQRVADEMGPANPAMARVLHSLFDDLRILPSRSDAFEKFGARADGLRRFGTMIYYGDPARADLLRAAHVERAEAFVLATDDPETSVRTARLVRRQYPHLKVFARARNRQHVFKLMDLGVGSIVRETFFSSLEIARGVFEALGYDEAAAKEYVRRFREHDERVLANQYPVYDDEAALLQSAQEARDDLVRLFEADTGEGDEA